MNYDAFANSFHKTRYAIWNQVGLFLDKIPKYASLLDCGCGNGKYAQYKKDIVYVGNDISLNLLEYASHKSDNILAANGLNLPYLDKIFDYSMSIAVLHHIDNHEKRKQFINELVRVTRNKILISVWAQEQEIKPNWINISGSDYLIPWQNKHLRYYHLFSKKELEELCSGLKYEIFFERDNWYVLLG